MAQQDTGLGWSAKEEWLVQAGNITVATLSEAGGPSYIGQPIPYATSPQEAVAMEEYWIYTALHYNSPRYDMYAYAQDDGVEIFIANVNNMIFCISPTQHARVAIARRDRTSGTIDRYTNNTVSIRDSATGLYFVGINSYGNITHDYCNPNLLWVTTEREALDALVISENTFTKTNQGYAVACLAKWKTDNNVLFTTPVLISTVSENTDMTCSDSTYNLAKLNIRMDGIQFYMSFFDVVDKSLQTNFETADLSMFKLDLDQVFKLIAQSGMANILITETVDPFKDFPYNGEDAGEINPNPQDNDVDFDDLPTRSFSTGGFCRIFNPDVSDLNDLASYMWTDQTFLQTVINHLKQILENPIEAIISLSLVPVSPPSSPTKVPVNVMFFNTGVTMRPVTSQFVTVDCGTTVLQESFGGALDYNPYTRVQMYLPYIGTVQLDTDEVMRKTLHLKYFVDIVTGICCAELKADDKLLYHFSGHCSVSQPITSADFSSYLNAAIAAAKLAVGVATGMAASTAAATAAQTPPAPSTPSSDSASTALVPVPTNQALVPGRGLAPRIQEPPQWDGSKLTALWGELSKPGNLNTAAAAMGGKMVVQHSGGFSGNSGYLAKRRPYLIVTRPRIANPEEYGQHNGRPSMMYLNLGNCTGYTQVQSVHLTGFDATNPELSEISTLLKGGVIL